MDGMSRKYTAYRIRSFAILWLVYAGYYLTRKNYAVAKSGLMDSMGLTEAQIGLIGGGFLAAYAVGMFVSGMMSDRFGARVMLVFGMVLSATASLFFGFTPSLALMILLWTANGLFQSTGWPASVKSMSQWFSVRERGKVMGLFCTNYQVGSALAQMFAAWTLGTWGLKSVFSIPAILLLVVAAIYVLFHKDTPEKAGLPPIEEYHGEKPVENVEASDAPAPAPEEESGSIILQVLSHPMVWLMGMSYFCLKFVRYALMFWLPLYMVKKLGYSQVSAGSLSAIPEIVGFLGTIFAGYVSDRFFGARRAPICALMFLGLVAACLIQPRLCEMGTLPTIIGLSVIFFMIFGPDSIMTGAGAMDFGTKRGAATAAGFINGCGSVGTAIQEPVIGLLATRFGEAGYNNFFYLMVPLAIIPFFLMLTQWNVKAKQS